MRSNVGKNLRYSIKNWIVHKARLGSPMRLTHVMYAVQNILFDEKRPNLFTDSRPGRKWFSLFLRRHLEIVMKSTETLSKARASMTKENILDWFKGLQDHLKSEKIKRIFDDSEQIMNSDELGMQTCPRTGKLLGPKGEKNLYQLASDPEKQSISDLCTFSADGTRYDPMIIYPCKKIPRDEAAPIPAAFSF